MNLILPTEILYKIGQDIDARVSLNKILKYPLINKLQLQLHKINLNNSNQIRKWVLDQPIFKNKPSSNDLSFINNLKTFYTFTHL